MSVEDMNKYRFSSMDEPTDEMLDQLMKEAADIARQKGQEAEARLNERIRQEVAEAKTRRQCAQ